MADADTELDRADLNELWHADAGRGLENKDRPAFVRQHRQAIMEHTNTDAPIPAGSLAEVRRWLDRYKGTVTRQLNDDADGTDPHDAESDTDADTEGNA